ncbi:hypothetical protein HNQ96_000194 [Aminobacter lissarensis]|uniref:Saccharopine dehydrogenase n=1 Tax=Aminobacter carboxidus TaxID=376165 RepID=A0A8E2BB02_9HYPH|nr:NAD(P)-dependent oxidoreductase [Aminobacter lissarensis]MBB6464347.1 hypothetical protein [Aminobacter lissarensis]
MTTHKPVLIIGGSGFVGALAARTLRKLHPALPIAIGGRNLEKAEAVAREIGNAEAVVIDLDRKDLGVPAHKGFGAIVMFVYDNTINALHYAQTNAVPYLGVSTGIQEIGPEIALYAHKATAPFLMGSSWLGGAASLAVVHFAKQFETVDSVEITALLDEHDMGGPAAEADFNRLTIMSSTLGLDDGKWHWKPSGEQGRTVTSVDGRQVPGLSYSPFDVFSLPITTGAETVRFDFALGETASRHRGEHFSTEITIAISGKRKDGTAGRSRYEFVHPEGQAPVTALAVALAVERLIGLDGKAPTPPGLYFAEMLVAADYAMKRFKEFGASITQAA